MSKGPLQQPVQSKPKIKDENSRPMPRQATAIQGSEGGSSDPMADHTSDNHHVWVPELILEELGEGSIRRGNFNVPEPRPVVHAQVRLPCVMMILFIAPLYDCITAMLHYLDPPAVSLSLCLQKCFLTPPHATVDCCVQSNSWHEIKKERTCRRSKSRSWRSLATHCAQPETSSSSSTHAEPSNISIPSDI
jgi:hypothetical protein